MSGRHFFLTQKNPFPEALEGNLFAKEHRHFDRPLDATLRVQGTCCGMRSVFCKDMPAPSVTLNSFQGLYKFWLNVLQIPNQVQHDGSLLKWRFFVGKVFFFETKRIRSLRLSKGTGLQRGTGPSTGSGTVLWYKDLKQKRPLANQ